MGQAAAEPARALWVAQASGTNGQQLSKGKHLAKTQSRVAHGWPASRPQAVTGGNDQSAGSGARAGPRRSHEWSGSCPGSSYRTVYTTRLEQKKYIIYYTINISSRILGTAYGYGTVQHPSWPCVSGRIPP